MIIIQALANQGLVLVIFVVRPVVSEERIEFAAANNGVNMNIPEINFEGGENGSFPSSVFCNCSINRQSVTRRLSIPERLTVFINDMPFEIEGGSFNVREAFGSNAMLINSFGQPILTDEFGVTFQPLHNGAIYYLL
ncbi:WUSCHEL-related homeobox 8 [Raphanus sativus]|nr:WUSCHEL-related homeobox 8 [Raphanus sativus]